MKENKYKIIFLGDPGVGKSSIINRFSQDKFDSNYQATIGLDFHTKTVAYENQSIKLLLYDTAGQEKFRSLIPMYIRDANIIIIVYDIGNKESFSHTSYWINEIKDLRREDSIIALVGNKCDVEKKQVTLEEGKIVASEKGLIFKEVSAKTGMNIESLFFKDIFELLVTKYNLKDIANEGGEMSQNQGDNYPDSSHHEPVKNIKLQKDEYEEETEKKKKKCC